MSESRELPPLGPGRRIGRYRLVRRLGAGGMGAVYEAEQDEPRRTVALKLLARAEDPEAVARFRYEAEVLAQLSHPGIAQVYESGVEQRGEEGADLFWFAMEHVAGARTLIEHAAAERLPLEDRLRLFLRVADAVQHGHQKGVIHRDLKPGNLLVDAAGHPKVIDFGIARISGEEGPQRSLRTSTGQVLGTLRYMSPEQVSGERGVVDVQSDVFALGLVLFELAAGRPAYELESLPLTEAVRAVADACVPALREVDRELPTELEWVVRRACAPERERRYPSASALAADVRRLLNGEAVAAGPTTIRYRARVFVRRHRLSVAAAAAVVLSLATALGVTTRSLARERRSLVAEREQRRRAEGNAAFLGEMLSSASPRQDGYEVRVVDVLDRASPRIAARYADQPLLRADLHYVVADVYRNFARNREAVEHAGAAVELREATLTPEDPELLKARGLLGIALRGDGQLEEASELLRRIIEVQESVYGASSEDVQRTRIVLIDSLLDAGRLDEAGEQVDLCLDEATPETVELDELTLLAVDRLVRLLFERRDFEALAPWIERLERASTELPPGLREQLAQALLNQGIFLAGKGEIDAAKEAFLDALDRALPVFGPNSQQTVSLLANLANLALVRGDGEDAMNWLVEARAAAEEGFGPDHPQTLELEYTYCATLWTLGEQERAEAELTALMERNRAARPDARLATAEWAGTLGRMRVALGRPEEAVPPLTEASAILSDERGDEHETTRVCLSWLARALRESGSPDEADAIEQRIR